MAKWMYENWPVTIALSMFLAGVLAYGIGELIPRSMVEQKCSYLYGVEHKCTSIPGGATSAMTARAVICTCN